MEHPGCGAEERKQRDGLTEKGRVGRRAVWRAGHFLPSLGRSIPSCGRSQSPTQSCTENKPSVTCMKLGTRQVTDSAHMAIVSLVFCPSTCSTAHSQLFVSVDQLTPSIQCPAVCWRKMIPEAQFFISTQPRLPRNRFLVTSMWAMQAIGQSSKCRTFSPFSSSSPESIPLIFFPRSFF